MANQTPSSQRFTRGALALVLVLLISVGVLGLGDYLGPTSDTASPATSSSATSSASQSPSADTELLEFRSYEKLMDHCAKHGDEVGCDSPEAYVAAANEVIHDPQVLHRIQKEDGDDAYFLPRTGEFVVVSSKGYLRTYFITDQDYFERQ